jgi:hypothetical protein
MGIAKINIWVSDVGDPCGTFKGGSECGGMHIFDCKGILEWPCGRYLAPDGTWQPVPGGKYESLPFQCGHLEVEVPPGCYWILAGYETKASYIYHLNYTTHVGIVQVGCNETACVKLFNPSIRLCWNWAWFGFRMLSLPRSQPVLRYDKVEQLGRLAKELLQPLSVSPIDEAVEKTLENIFEAAQRGNEEKQGKKEKQEKKEVR